MISLPVLVQPNLEAPSLVPRVRLDKLQGEEEKKGKKIERFKKYAAIDALIFPAKAWTSGSINVAPYEPLTALPGAFARSNFAQLIPQDGRVELNFDFPWEQHGTGIQGREYQNRFFKEAQLTIEALNSSWGTIQTFGHFIIWDEIGITPRWSKECYFMYNIGHDSPYGVLHPDHNFGIRENTERLGYHTILSQRQKNQEGSGSIQPPYDNVTKRIIIYQGLPLILPATPSYRALPFLVTGNNDSPMSIAISRHMLCQRKTSNDATNPYLNIDDGFHITFYEMLPRDSPSGLIEVSRQKKLKIGYLYGKPGRNSSNSNGKKNGPAFRESSFTIIPKQRSSSSIQDYWTVLILSPSNFFRQPAEDKLDIKWKSVLSKKDLLIAEAIIIVVAIKKVEDRWRDLNEYIGSLLVEDFMDPKSYAMLLFDDETFSRSRLYFWIIGCLNEFNISIEDNIKQWKLFRQARIDPELEKLEDLDIEEKHRDKLKKLQNLYMLGEEIRQGLEDVQSQFQAKLATVQNLRDGLFNASALIESRSSTRLGQNVKLLTYVSIVYLPLAFCAALWAVPDISNNDTRTPFIITTILVGCATYIVVFNLENIVDIMGKSYTGYRSRLLENMSEDHDSYWQSLRERFEEFPPNNEQRKPSEWWIVRYQIQKWFRRADQNLHGLWMVYRDRATWLLY